MSSSPDNTEEMLQRARAGDLSALGVVLGQYRQYLQRLAQIQVRRDLRARLDPSDLVQETLLEAQRDFVRFTGGSSGEWTAWLRQILLRNLADQFKHHCSRKRDFRRDMSLDVVVQSEPAFAAPISTPSAHISRREQTEVLARAMAELPPDYREVLRLRHLEQRSFESVAAQMNRSCGAVRMLWMRAVERLGVMVEVP